MRSIYLPATTTSVDICKMNMRDNITILLFLYFSIFSEDFLVLIKQGVRRYWQMFIPAASDSFRGWGFLCSSKCNHIYNPR